jgi:6-phosphogluconolactonase
MEVAMLQEQFLIGTYSNKDSEGIYEVTLDTNQERLINDHVLIKIKKPQYLQIGSDHRVYTIERGPADLGGIAVYELQDGTAKRVSEVMWHGPTPAYLGLDEKRHLLFAANYHGSWVDVFQIQPDGQLIQTDHLVHDGPTGPRPEQDMSHLHYADILPDGRLITCDLGEDMLNIYDVTDKGKLVPVSGFHSHPGFGTRHLVCHPNGKYIYVVGELSSEVEAFEYDQLTGQLHYIANRKTIPADWKVHNGAAAIRMTHDGRFVYISNRGENTIAVFKVLDDFTLEKVQAISTEGEFPRDFNFSQNEDYLIAANQNTENLTLFRRNPETGLLTLIQKGVASPEAINVQPVGK